MLTSLLKRKTRESGFTMIELLVAVVIIAILAAIAVPVYLNLKTEAVKSALKSDVNATVKAAAIALTQGTDISVITANQGAAYVPANPAKGETITIVQAQAPNTATGAAFVQNRDDSSDGYVIKSATYSGSATGVAQAKTVISTADDQYFFVYGVLSKSAGAPVDYTYSYTSAKDTYSQSGSNGNGSTVAAAPALPATVSLPTATLDIAYSSAAVTATGTPAPVLKATGLPTGLTMNSATGVISGTPSGAAQSYTVTVTATNGVGSDTKTYTLNLQSGDVTPAFTSSATAPSGRAGTAYAGYTVAATGTPTPTFASTDLTSKTGLVIDSATGVISGTLSSGISGNIQVSIIAHNRKSDTPQNLVIPVQAPAAITNSAAALPASTQFSTYTGATITATGFPAPTFSVPSATGTLKTGLPIGLSLDANTGVISGTPSSATTGSFSFTVTATNGVGTAAIKAFTMTVNPVAPLYSTSSNTFDSTWTQYGATTLNFNGSGMQMIRGSTSTDALAYKDVSGFVVGKSYTISMDVYADAGSGNANLSGPGWSSTSVFGPTNNGAEQHDFPANFTVTQTFTAPTTTVRLWAIISNHFSYIRQGTVTSYKVTAN